MAAVVAIVVVVKGVVAVVALREECTGGLAGELYY